MAVIWKFKLMLGDLFHNDDLSFTERRDQITFRIRHTPWYRKADREDDGELLSIVDDLAAAPDEDDFDEAWDALYDWADDARVWIDIVSRQREEG